jgi:DNA-binding beta-propeller fold protein YncE
MVGRRTILAGALGALVLALPTATGAESFSAPRPAASAGLIKHLAQGSFVLPASLAGGHIGGIALDAAGNIYAAVDRLQKPYIVAFDAKGTYLRSWQAGTGTGSIYRIPLTLGPDGLIYIIPEESVDTIKVFTTAGTLVRQFGTGSHIRVPSDIEVDQSGNVYVTSFPNPAAGIQHDVVTRLNPSGAVTGQWQPLPGGGVAGSGSPPKLRGIAVEPGGSMWVTTADRKDRLLHLDANGKRLKTWDPALVIPGSKANQFRDVDYADGRLYFGGSFSGANNAHFTNALAVVTPAGKLLDELVGAAAYVAAGSGRVYLSAKVPAPAGARVLSSIDGVVSLIELLASPPNIQDAAGASCGGQDYYPVGGGRNTADIVLPHNGSGCMLDFANYGSPCPSGGGAPTPYLGGRPAGELADIEDQGDGTSLFRFRFSASDLAGGSGSVVIQWECSNTRSTMYEYKGDVALLDPSGTVVDRTTRRPVTGATVRLQVSPIPGRPFGTPGISSYEPQLNPETTGPSGTFAWDVAPGRWRLRVTAYGYRSFVSNTYKVPPAVTHLRLQLIPDPRTQRLLIDPAGRVGAVRLRGPGGRVAGLRIVLAGHRIRTITVSSKRFRTALAIRLGSSEADLQRAYPKLLKVAKKLAKKTTRLYHVKHATFAVHRGRVTAIKLS